MNILEALKPGVPKNWLQLLAGVIWTGVGVFLISLALEWTLNPTVARPWPYLFPGLVLASLIYQFGFSRLARKNSRRIEHLGTDKPCLFAFQEWHSYPLVLVMIALGIGLRKYFPLPKPLLGILYLGIGGGLGSASLFYYRAILQSLSGNSDRDITNHQPPLTGL